MYSNILFVIVTKLISLLQLPTVTLLARLRNPLHTEIPGFSRS